RAAVGERAEREDVDDVTVADLIDRARFGDEPRHHLGIDRELAGEDLDGNDLADQRMDSLEHRTKTTLADLALDRVLADHLAGFEVRVQSGRDLTGWS